MFSVSVSPPSSISLSSVLLTELLFWYFHQHYHYYRHLHWHLYHYRHNNSHRLQCQYHYRHHRRYLYGHRHYQHHCERHCSGIVIFNVTCITTIILVGIVTLMIIINGIVIFVIGTIVNDTVVDLNVCIWNRCSPLCKMIQDQFKSRKKLCPTSSPNRISVKDTDVG